MISEMFHLWYSVDKFTSCVVALVSTAAIEKSTVLRQIYRLNESETARGSGSNLFLDPDIKVPE